MTQDHPHRVTLERDELRARLNRLSDFMRSPKFDTLNVQEQARLTVQASAMRTYHACLCERIETFPC